MQRGDNDSGVEGNSFYLHINKQEFLNEQELYSHGKIPWVYPKE